MVVVPGMAGLLVTAAALGSAAPARARGVETVNLTSSASPEVFELPAGSRVDRLAPRTPYGTRTRLWVRARKPGWLRVAALDAPGHAGWIRASLTRPGPRLWRRIEVDRSARRLTVIGSRGRWSVRVGVGTPATPTPTGTFQITDRIRGSRFGGVYGAWILVLSTYGPGTTTDRMALHGIPPSAASVDGSAGCVRIPAAALARLAREAPPGTPVRISE